MKNYFLSAFALASMLASCAADKNEKIAPGDVPPAVVSTFSNQYPGAADTKWEKEDNDGKITYEAHFKYDGKNMEAEFDETGALVDGD